jgi:hypothetical protein
MRRVRFTEPELREAVARSYSIAETLRNLGMSVSGGNHATIRKYLALWEIGTHHFDPLHGLREARARPRPRPLWEVLVKNSTYSRGTLKQRLYHEGLKERCCELCGQDESWMGSRIALILDHVNGCSTDNRLENLRIVCPNCAATLDTHCGRNPALRDDRVCERCGRKYRPRAPGQRHCSATCGQQWDRSPLRVPRPDTRKVERPSLEQLRTDLEHMSYVAVGRKYGVSDNAIRKWLRWYEAAEERREAA